MARTHGVEVEEAPVAYRGEVWTDGRGCAVVVLPPEADGLTGPLAYTLETAEPSVTAAVTGELEGGQFTIETNEPHVKVAWRVTAYRASSDPEASAHTNLPPGGGRTMKKLVPLLAALARALSLAAGASADAPTSVTQQVHLVTNPYITCSNFVVIGDFYVTRTVTTFYDNDGNAIKQVLHIHVDGTVSNSVTGASLDFLREGTFTQDLLDGSTVTAGQRTLVTAPGSGVVLQDMGRIVREGGAIVFQAGPSDFLDYQSGDRTGIEDLCAALS